MNYFILTENIMNGTFTMDSVVSLVEAENFELAKDVLKRLFVKSKIDMNIVTDDDKKFIYTNSGDANLSIKGVLKNEDIKIFR